MGWPTSLLLDTWSSRPGGIDPGRRARRWWIDLAAAALFLLGLVGSAAVEDPPPGWLLVLFGVAALLEGVRAGYWYAVLRRPASPSG